MIGSQPACKPAFSQLVNRLLAFFAVLTFALPAHAHIGSKDVYQEVNVGGYKLFVVIRTPKVIPGVAGIEVRSTGAAVRSIHITPTPLTGEAAKHPPTPDTMKASSADPNFFTGSLWLMASGSWQVHFDLEGAAGTATAGVPVPAIPLSILPMQRSLGILLAILGILLVAGITGIVFAAVGQARLEPGVAPNQARRRRAWMASAATLAIALLFVYAGAKWWNAEAVGYAEDVYRPLSLTPELSGNRLTLKIGRYDRDARHRFRARSNDDLLPDHGHVMHLYAIREPGMDAVYHLHPALAPDNSLTMTLPSMPPGAYRLYADIVHASGFPETLTADLVIPADMSSAPLAAEDASAAPPPLSEGELGNAYKLPDGYTMIWDRPSDLSANQANAFRFRLIDAKGQPARDERPYLGMAGHAAFVKTDGTVFAHTHPEGSASMQAVMLANGGSENMDGTDGMDGSMANPSSKVAQSLPPIVEFPYGFPSPGRYRIFIQMKHGGTVETGVFDAEVH
ncbi:MAG: hypothetical protein WA510_15245 [Acidobacteriaceae bacterium]